MRSWCSQIFEYQVLTVVDLLKKIFLKIQILSLFYANTQQLNRVKPCIVRTFVPEIFPHYVNLHWINQQKKIVRKLSKNCTKWNIKVKSALKGFALNGFFLKYVFYAKVTASIHFPWYSGCNKWISRYLSRIKFVF